MSNMLFIHGNKRRRLRAIKALDALGFRFEGSDHGMNTIIVTDDKKCEFCTKRDVSQHPAPWLMSGSVFIDLEKQEFDKHGRIV